MESLKEERGLKNILLLRDKRQKTNHPIPSCPKNMHNNNHKIIYQQPNYCFIKICQSVVLDFSNNKYKITIKNGKLIIKKMTIVIICYNRTTGQHAATTGCLSRKNKNKIDKII